MSCPHSDPCTCNLLHHIGVVMFSEPQAGGDRVNPRDIVGQLIVVRPTEYKRGIPTQFSKSPEGSDAIEIDLVNLDERDDYGQPGNVYRGVLWFQGQLIGALKKCVGQTLLGRIARGQGRPGMNAPYIFESATSETTAVARAQAWLAKHPEFTQPASAQTSGPPVQMPMPAAQPTANPQQQQTVLDQLRRQAQQPVPGQYTPSNVEDSRYTQTATPPY